MEVGCRRPRDRAAGRACGGGRTRPPRSRRARPARRCRRGRRRRRARGTRSAGSHAPSEASGRRPPAPRSRSRSSCCNGRASRNRSPISKCGGRLTQPGEEHVEVASLAGSPGEPGKLLPEPPCPALVDERPGCAQEGAKPSRGNAEAAQLVVLPVAGVRLEDGQVRGVHREHRASGARGDGSARRGTQRPRSECTEASRRGRFREARGAGRPQRPAGVPRSGGAGRSSDPLRRRVRPARPTRRVRRR